MRVKATREGLIGNRTASGYIIDKHVPYVALPSTRALHQFVKIHNPWNKKTCMAIVLDVGPWNINDDAYVFDGSRPQAESGRDRYGRETNLAGIDLGEKVWNDLDMKENSDVDWEFVIV